MTQNVDNLHERAGSNNIIHLQNLILKTRCIECNNTIFWTLKTLENSNQVPKCTTCRSILRPEVGWFGERLQPDIINESFKRLSVTQLLLVTGTSGLVYPVAELPFFVKQKNPEVEIYEFNMKYTSILKIGNKTLLGYVEETLPDFFFGTLQKDFRKKSFVQKHK